jgi:hypothetical protein
MAQSVSWGNTERFVLERWTTARDLTEAYRATRVKTAKQLRRVAKDITSSVAAQGYELTRDLDWAEFKAFKQKWCLPDGDPLVLFSVSAVFPMGYYRVAHPNAYSALYLNGFEDGAMSDATRFAREVRSAVGPQADGWADRTVDEWCPLWRDLPDLDDEKRASLALNAGELRQFALGELKRLFAFGDAVDKVIPSFFS